MSWPGADLHTSHYACLPGDAVSEKKDLCKWEIRRQLLVPHRCLCWRKPHAFAADILLLKTTEVLHVMIIAQKAAVRAKPSYRAAGLQRTQPRQAHCGISFNSFHFAAGCPEYELFASCTYCSSTSGTPSTVGHRVIRVMPLWCTSLSLVWHKPPLYATTARCFQTRAQAMEVGLPGDV